MPYPNTSEIHKMRLLVLGKSQKSRTIENEPLPVKKSAELKKFGLILHGFCSCRSKKNATAEFRGHER